MKTLYGKLNVLKFLKLPALIIFLLAFSYYASAQRSNTPVCEGQTLQLFAEGGICSITGYTSLAWYAPAGNGAAQFSSGDLNPTIAAGSVYYPTDWGGLDEISIVYSLTASGGSGTPKFGETVVRYVKTPTVAISGAASVCAGASASYTSTTTGLWAVSTGYVVTPASGVSSKYGTISFVGADPGSTQTITVTVTPVVDGCSFDITKSVYIYPTVAPSFIVSPTLHTCSPGCDIPFSTQSGMTNYNWWVSPSDEVGFTPVAHNTSNVLINFHNIGDYVVYVSYTDPATGCSGTGSMTVHIALPDQPILNPGANASICSTPQKYIITNWVSGLRYEWTYLQPGSAIALTATSFTSSIVVNWTSSGTGTVTCQAFKPDCDCSGSLVVCNEYKVYPVGPVTITGPEAICLESGVAHAHYSVSAANGDTYSWTIEGDGVITNALTKTATVTWGSTASITTINVKVYNTISGCMSETHKHIVIGSVEDIHVDGEVEVCQGTYVNYTTASGLDYYHWEVTNDYPLPYPTIVSGQGTYSITVYWGIAATSAKTLSGTVQVYTEYGGCTGYSDPLHIDIGTPFNITNATFPSPVCTYLSSGSTYDYYLEEDEDATYQWSVTGPTGTEYTEGFTNSITVAWGSPGNTYGTVDVRVTRYGCATYTNTVVTIMDAPAGIVTIVAASGTFTVCANSTAQYYTAYKNANYTYHWDVSGNVSLSGENTRTITVVWGSTVHYGIVTVTVRNANAPCPVIESEVIHIGGVPVIEGTLVVCQNSCETGYYDLYSVANYDPDHTYQWSVSGGIIIGGDNTGQIGVCWTTCPAGYLQVTENDGTCIGTSAVYTVTIQPKPAPVITGPLTINTNEVATYTTPGYAGRLYTWSVTGGKITGGQGTNAITVSWGPIPPCWCGEVEVCESAVYTPTATVQCTGCTEVQISLMPTNATIAGKVSYKNSYGTKLNGVEVVLRNYATGTIVAETVTGPDIVGGTGEPGSYAFVNIPVGTATNTVKYSISASEYGYDNPWGGNNATDALLVLLHGTTPLNGLYLLAGDVNGSSVGTVPRTVNATDALLIKLRTVGMISDYAAGDWMFEKKDTLILSGLPRIWNFGGLCVGDVNGSHIPVGVKSAPLLSTIDDGVQTVGVNTSFTYELRSNAVANLGAMTLNMTYDESMFEIEKVITVIDGMEYSVKNGQIVLAWADTRTINVNSNDVIISLQMKAKETLTGATQVFELQPGSEFADATAQPLSLDLKMAKIVAVANTEFTLNNYPNPFSNSTDIVYNLPEAGTVKLIVTDMLGKTVNTIVNSVVQNAGTYKVTINAADGKMNQGVYMYRLEVEGASKSYVKTNKMILTR